MNEKKKKIKQNLFLQLKLIVMQFRPYHFLSPFPRTNMHPTTAIIQCYNRSTFVEGRVSWFYVCKEHPNVVAGILASVVK